MIDKLFGIEVSETDDLPHERCVVRLSSSTWSDKRGVHYKRSLTFLRRQCIGYNLLEEDVSAIGAEDAVASIVNLNDCDDGVYEVVACNMSRDWETGYIDSYELKLISYKPED